MALAAEEGVICQIGWQHSQMFATDLSKLQRKFRVELPNLEPLWHCLLGMVLNINSKNNNFWLQVNLHRPEMSQIKTEINFRTNVTLIFHKNVGWQGYQCIP